MNPVRRVGLILSGKRFCRRDRINQHDILIASHRPADLIRQIRKTADVKIYDISDRNRCLFLPAGVIVPAEQFCGVLLQYRKTCASHPQITPDCDTVKDDCRRRPAVFVCFRRKLKAGKNLCVDILRYKIHRSRYHSLSCLFVIVPRLRANRLLLHITVQRYRQKLIDNLRLLHAGKFFPSRQNLREIIRIHRCADVVFAHPQLLPGAPEQIFRKGSRRDKQKDTHRERKHGGAVLSAVSFHIFIGNHPLRTKAFPDPSLHTDLLFGKRGICPLFHGVNRLDTNRAAHRKIRGDEHRDNADCNRSRYRGQ